MIHALLHGKLSTDQANMEDILTSNVFGPLRYVPPEHGLLPFLAHASSADRTKLELRAAVPGVEMEVVFWPALQAEGCAWCEPDVLIRLAWPEPAGRRFLVLVEAKYLSGKSSEADDASPVPFDQLARQWDNLAVLAKKEGREPILIYLTATFGRPVEEFLRSAADHHEKTQHPGLPFKCYWLSWRHLSLVAKSAAERRLAASAARVFEDLGNLLRHLDLVFFGGFSVCRPDGAVRWSFNGGRLPAMSSFVGFTSLGSVQPIRWVFGARGFRLSCAKLPPIAWRFGHG